MTRRLPFAPALFAAALLAAPLGLSLTATPARAESTVTASDMLEGTGAACLLGGTAAGVLAAASGSIIAAPLAAATTALAPAPTAAAVAASGLMGCGLAASAAVIYYGTSWIYGTFFVPSEYPLLYPAPPSEDGAAASDGIRSDSGAVPGQEPGIDTTGGETS